MRFPVLFLSASLPALAALLGLAFSDLCSAQTLLSPMVPQFHRWHMEKAPEMVRAVARPENGARQVQFTVLMLAELDEKFRVQRWGALWDKAKEGDEFVFAPVREEMRVQIRDWLAAGFRAAVEAKLDIAVLCQVDAHGKVQEWRNFFDFDPTAKLAGWSYEEMMTRTVLEALEAAVPPEWPVELVLEGEMGRTLFSYPSAWLALLERAKARGKLKGLSVGISANYENCRGQVKPDATPQKEMNALIKAADFVGISCYAKTSLPPQASDFTATVEHFAREFAEAGCPIPNDKPLRFTEIGLGGGGFDKDWKLTVPSPTPEGMTRAAFFGTDELVKNPWVREDLRDFRRQWHCAALDFLATPHSPWRVQSAWLWSFGSFDVHGLEKPEFRDEEIVKMIQEHNLRVEGPRKPESTRGQ